MTPQRYHRLTNALNCRQPDITVILENVSDPHNVAAVLRTADAIGIQEIYVLNDEAPRKRNWGFKCSGGSEKWVTVHHFDNKQACIDAVRKQYQYIFSTHLSTDAMSLYEIDFATNSIALVFGNELDGISAFMKDCCDGNFMIPMRGVTISLNISVACAVSLYEAQRQKNLAGHYDHPKLNEAAIDVLKEKWNVSLPTSKI